MTRKRQRLYVVGLGLTGLAVAAALTLTAFQDNLVFFFSPSDVMAGKVETGSTFRIGGLVADGSVVRQDDGLTVRFDVTDQAHTVPVTFTGILPDLFREGQGVVAQGSLGDDGLFVAQDVLAKHDENYMPPEVYDALKRGAAEAQAAGAGTGYSYGGANYGNTGYGNSSHSYGEDGS